MFESVLIANRGEIAIRIIRACRQMGIRSIAVYSDADEWAPHAVEADEAVHLGPAPAAESYLVVDKLIAAIKSSGAQAVHPGYGFLSENAEFAQAVIDAGAVFIGPSPATIAAVGNKVNAKVLAKQAGAPIIPGLSDGVTELDASALVAAAGDIGLPILVKARSGGGGKGMRLVTEAAALPAAVATASSEAKLAFNDPTVYLERALLGMRHVEVQILRDSHGHTIALGERECSVQRRHQKLIEESPSPAVDAELRARLAAASIGVADAANYEGAGTVEYLLSPEGEFFFLEVNARLQVEHPVSELVTGVDLVLEQFRIASGQPISDHALASAAAGLRGHAIEARIYAEVAAGGGAFVPSTGRIVAMRAPEGPGVRFDAGVTEGTMVSHHYDPMLAKVIAWGDDREQARRRLLDALRELTIVGVETCQPFHLSVMALDAFVSGDLDTNFLTRPEVQAALDADNTMPAEAAVIAAGLAHLRRAGNGHGNGNGNGNGHTADANGRSAWGRDALRRNLRPGGRV